MKKHLLFVLTLPLFTVAAAQQFSCPNTIVDEIRYVEDSKTSGFAAISMNYRNDGGSYGYSGYAQLYQAPDTVTIVGVTFYGFDAGTAAPSNMTVELYTADAGGMPDQLLEAVNYTLPVLPGFNGPYNSPNIYNQVSFLTPHIVEGDYIIAIHNEGDGDYYLSRNLDGDGAAEAYALTYYEGVTNPTWDGWYSMYSFGAGWNFDMLISPVVQYELDQVVQISEIMFCAGTTVSVNATAGVVDDEIFYHKMYNPNYATYNGMSVSFNYDYGDGSSDDTGIHDYNVGGGYDLVSEVGYGIGLWGASELKTSCMVSLVVLEASVDIGMDTVVCNNESINFDAGSFVSYSWSTGGSGQTETFGPWAGADLEIVSVTVVDADGCMASDSLTIQVDDCNGIAENELKASIYPLPSLGTLTIALGDQISAQVFVYDLLGQLVHTGALNSDKNQIDLSHCESGVYIAKIANMYGEKVIKFEIHK